MHPHSPMTYGIVLGVVGLFAYWELFLHPHHPIIDRWAVPLIWTVILLIAAQAVSRLLLPVWSAKLTNWLSTRQFADGALRFSGLLLAALLIFGLVRGIHSELRMLANISIFLLFAMADLFGKESWAQRPKEFSTQTSAPWRETLQPIQSGHWGER